MEILIINLYNKRKVVILAKVRLFFITTVFDGQ